MDFFLLLVDLPFYAKQETIFPVTVQQQKHSSKNKHNFKECLSIRSGFIEWKTTNMEKKLKNGQSKSAVQEIRDFYVGLLSKDE